jgi:hypothetical protein
MIIKDGTGTGYQQRVDSNNRAQVFSVAITDLGSNH